MQRNYIEWSFSQKETFNQHLLANYDYKSQRGSFCDCVTHTYFNIKAINSSLSKVTKIRQSVTPSTTSFLPFLQSFAKAEMISFEKERIISHDVIHFSGVVERLLNLSSRSRAAAYPTSNGHQTSTDTKTRLTIGYGASLSSKTKRGKKSYAFLLSCIPNRFLVTGIVNPLNLTLICTFIGQLITVQTRSNLQQIVIQYYIKVDSISNTFEIFSYLTLIFGIYSRPFTLKG